MRHLISSVEVSRKNCYFAFLFNCMTAVVKGAIFLENLEGIPSHLVKVSEGSRSLIVWHFVTKKHFY